MADDGDLFFARLILVFCECSSERSRSAENVEVGRRDDGGAKRSRLATGCGASCSARVAQDAARDRGHRLERLGLPRPVDVIRSGDTVPETAWRLFPDLDDAFRLRVADGLEEHAVDEAEDRGVGPKAERNRQDGKEGEAGTASERSPRITQVLAGGVKCGIHVRLDGRKEIKVCWTFKLINSDGKQCSDGRWALICRMHKGGVPAVAAFAACCFGLLLAGAVATAARPQAGLPPLSFNRDVRP